MDRSSTVRGRSAIVSTKVGFLTDQAIEGALSDWRPARNRTELSRGHLDLVFAHTDGAPYEALRSAFRNITLGSVDHEDGSGH
ncbi:hypothetical protein ACIREM_00290 [Streptomyces shenzhenensis]|uniref:hypothetical protein n=1 Tax=Streptomyces shenzhenensis TaxID=943815 RepID=UPI0038020B27